MVIYVIKKAFAKLSEKPFLLWGLSLLAAVTTAVVSVAFGILPIIGIAFSLVIDFGSKMIFLNAVNEKTYNEDQLFAGFRDVKRVFPAMAIKELWLLLWFIIPIVGPILYIIKNYQYSFVPYILATDSEVTMGKALDISKEKTKGYKHVMFWSDVLLGVPMLAFLILVSIFRLIPYVGVVLNIVLFLAYIVYCLAMPLLQGLIHAYIWQEEENPSYVAPVPAAPVAPQYPQYPQQPGYPQQQPTEYPQQDYSQYAQPAYPQQPYTYAPQQPAYQPYAAPEAPQYPTSEPVAAPAEEPAPETPAEAAGTFCPNCGAPLAPGAMFCGKCGYRLG